ncbi:MAG TPA: Eco29kI family restriction endonuclease [Bryobacteraceae bacterium]|jgi:hypothetical protein
MHSEPAFNPLDKKNLGISVENALLARPRSPLPPPDKFIGAGVYAIYYKGNFAAYKALAARNRADNGRDVPIYVGKAVPAGARKGGFGLDVNPGAVLCNRLEEHAESIKATENLKLADFFCRYLTVDDIWIPLGESLLIEMFSPVWNRVIDGFGNHDPGKGRHQGRIPAWDVIHPGRPWAKRLQSGKSLHAVEESIKKFFADHPLK